MSLKQSHERVHFYRFLGLENTKNKVVNGHWSTVVTIDNDKQLELGNQDADLHLAEFDQLKYSLMQLVQIGVENGFDYGCKSTSVGFVIWHSGETKSFIRGNEKHLQFMHQIYIALKQFLKGVVK